MNMNLSINIIDLIAIVFMIFAGFFGFRKGFISIFFDTLALSISFYISANYHLFFENKIYEFFGIRNAWLSFFALIFTYLGSFFIFRILGMFLTKIFNKTNFGEFNKYLGMFLNMFKYFLIILIIIIMLLNVPNDFMGNSIKGSFLYTIYIFLSDYPIIRNFIPPILL
jgi:membrane protein required for colicin V production